MTMAQAALHVCNKCGCHRLTHDTYCELHQHLKRQYDDRRQSASEDITDVGEKQARHIYCHIRFAFVVCNREDTRKPQL